MAITTDDFNKIWASTSPLTPYEFSESNYKEGWNFIGGTPPSRQMWDFLQKNNDEKTQYLLNNFDNYLPLSGGTLTGDVNGVTPADSDDSTKLATTEFVDNVFLSKIISKLQEVSDLPAGTSFPSTTVLSKMISNMMAEDGVQYNLSNSSAWYIKLGAKYGGLIIQGGKFRVPTTTSWTEYPLPISFTDADYSILGTMGATNGVVEAYSGGHSKFNYKAVSFSGGTWTNEPLHWLAVGH